MVNGKSDYEVYYEYLDALRESGVTNMFGSVPYLMEEFEWLATDEAKEIVISWMCTFKQRHPNAW